MHNFLIDDVKRTGLFAGSHTCKECGNPTEQAPIRVTLVYEDGDFEDVYYDENCYKIFRERRTRK
jgi:hypothetical protein